MHRELRHSLIIDLLTDMYPEASSSIYGAITFAHLV